jgi:hypothetical protein
MHRSLAIILVCAVAACGTVTSSSPLPFPDARAGGVDAGGTPISVDALVDAFVARDAPSAPFDTF